MTVLAYDGRPRLFWPLVSLPSAKDYGSRACAACRATKPRKPTQSGRAQRARRALSILRYALFIFILKIIFWKIFELFRQLPHLSCVGIPWTPKTAAWNPPEPSTSVYPVIGKSCPLPRHDPARFHSILPTRRGRAFEGCGCSLLVEFPPHTCDQYISWNINCLSPPHPFTHLPSSPRTTSTCLLCSHKGWWPFQLSWLPLLNVLRPH